MENENESSEKHESPSAPPAGDSPTIARKGKSRAGSSASARSGDSILQVLVNKFLSELRANYSEARGALQDLRKRSHEELLTRGILSTPPPSRLPAGPLQYKNLASDVPTSRAAQSLAKGQAILDPAKATGIRPIQGKEAGTRFKNVLIVGGMDFLGAALVHQLNAIGFRDVTVADSLDDAVCERLPALRFQEFLGPEEFGKLASARFRTLPVFSHIFYLGPWKMEAMGLPKSLLGATLRQGARFTAISSAASMGPQPGNAEQRADPQNFRPLAREGLASCLFDRHALLKAPFRSYVSLKSHRLFGPGERPDGGLGGLVKSCHGLIRAAGSVALPGALRPDATEGRRKFDFFPVLDAAKLALYLAQNPYTSGIYELGSGASSTPGDLIRAVFQALDRPEQIAWDDSLAYEPPSPQPERASLGRLDEVGWRAMPPDLRGAVRQYVAAYLNESVELGEEPSESSRDEEKNPSATTALIPKKRQRLSYAD